MCIWTRMYLQLITYTMKCPNSLQVMVAPPRKIGKKKGHFWMFGWWVWFFTHWSGATALVEKDEADSFHRWPQYNALPGRVKGCYSFRYSNKVQLRFWLIQNFFWKPKSRGIDVPLFCEMSCKQPVRYNVRVQCTYTVYVYSVLVQCKRWSKRRRGLIEWSAAVGQPALRLLVLRYDLHRSQGDF